MADDDSIHVEMKLPAEGKREPEVNKLFRSVMKHEGSDLHLKVGLPPMMRHRGIIKKMDLPALTQEQMEKLLTPIISQRHLQVLEDAGAATSLKSSATTNAVSASTCCASAASGRWSLAASATKSRPSISSTCRPRSKNSVTSTRE